MAVPNLFASTKETFRVVTSHDNCLAEDFALEEYDAYLKTLDESLLRRAEGNDEPFTYFHLKLAQDAHQALSSGDSTFNLGGPNAKILSNVSRVVELSLVDITVGADSLFRKGKNGTPSDELMLGLIQTGIVLDLFKAVNARKESIYGRKSLELTKKN